MKIIERTTQIMNKVLLFFYGWRDRLKTNPNIFLDEYAKCKHMILHCIDEDITTPVPRQLLTVIPRDNYHAFVNLFLALQMLMKISANFEAEGYEVSSDWNQRLMSCHRHLTERLYHGLSRSDKFQLAEDESELIRMVDVSLETLCFEPLFAYNYKSKDY